MTGEQAREDFFLMNRDETLAAFHVDVKFDTIYVDEVFWEQPGWVGDLAVFIGNRKAPKQRENMQELLKLRGCDTTLGWLQISHALSLVDTFWVKPRDSKLRWEDMSLYTHDFNEVIAKTAFEGGLHGRNLFTTSPEYGTDGSFAKCWVRESGNIKLLKRGSSGARNAGLEPYAGQVIKEFTKDFVPYDLRSVSGRVCSVCPTFTTEEYGFLPYAAVEQGNSTVDSVIRTMDSYGLGDKARLMFVVDAVIMNEDRHKNNFGFIVENRTQKIVDMAPLFDHNISLLPYAEEEQFEEIEKYLNQKGPRLDRTWVLSAAKCLTPQAKRSLVRLRDFEFEKHGKFDLPSRRLERLSELVRKMVMDILEF